MKANRPTRRVTGVLGVAFDAQDGQKRVTRGPDFVLAGGSADSHKRMQDTMIQVGRKLEERGKRVRDASPNELRDLIAEANE